MAMVYGSDTRESVWSSFILSLLMGPVQGCMLALELKFIHLSTCLDVCLVLICALLRRHNRIVYSPHLGSPFDTRSTPDRDQISHLNVPAAVIHLVQTVHPKLETHTLTNPLSHPNTHHPAPHAIAHLTTLLSAGKQRTKRRRRRAKAVKPRTPIPPPRRRTFLGGGCMRRGSASRQRGLGGRLCQSLLSQPEQQLELELVLGSLTVAAQKARTVAGRAHGCEVPRAPQYFDWCCVRPRAGLAGAACQSLPRVIRRPLDGWLQWCMAAARDSRRVRLGREGCRVWDGARGSVVVRCFIVGLDCARYAGFRLMRSGYPGVSVGSMPCWGVATIKRWRKKSISMSSC